MLDTSSIKKGKYLTKSELSSSYKIKNIRKAKLILEIVTNFIQLVSLQLVDQFSQTKLHWKAPNKGYPHICGMYKSDNK